MSIDEKLRAALKNGIEPSEAFEATLFARAEVLLATRRKKEAAPIQVRARAKANSFLNFLVEHLLFQPQFPATLATLTALLIAVVTLLPHSAKVHYSEVWSSQTEVHELVSPLPKNNAFPAQYDSQRLADERAYEREVEDAHKRTSGGI